MIHPESSETEPKKKSDPPPPSPPQPQPKWPPLSPPQDGDEVHKHEKPEELVVTV